MQIEQEIERHHAEAKAFKAVQVQLDHEFELNKLDRIELVEAKALQVQLEEELQQYKAFCGALAKTLIGDRDVSDLSTAAELGSFSTNLGQKATGEEFGGDVQDEVVEIKENTKMGRKCKKKRAQTRGTVYNPLFFLLKLRQVGTVYNPLTLC